MTRLRSLAELLAAALCLWAAWYHTPAGALVRSGVALVLGGRSSARPLLSYYSAGAFSQRQISAPPAVRGALPPGLALGHALQAVLADLPASEREQRAARWGRTPQALARSAQALSARLGSDDAAALALFAGEEPARFALRAAGPEADLTALARALPPGLDEEVACAARALMLGTAWSLRWPVDPRAPITSPFGAREHPVLGGRRMHTGVDIGLPVGTPVHAAGPALVRRASSDGVNGRVLTLDHGHGVTTSYCHNDALVVAKGQEVAAGQVIARSGNTGRSTGPHLHYQVEVAGRAVDPVGYRGGRTRRSPGGQDD